MFELVVTEDGGAVSRTECQSYTQARRLMLAELNIRDPEDAAVYGVDPGDGSEKRLLHYHRG